MGCNCGKNRTVSGGGPSAAGTPGTYRVMVGTRKVYETTNPAAADTVAARFNGANILKPGETA